MRIFHRNLLPITNETVRSCVIGALLVAAPVGVIGLMVAAGVH